MSHDFPLDSDASPFPRVEAWVKGRLQREYPDLSEQAIASAIRTAVELMDARSRGGAILSAARICLLADGQGSPGGSDGPSPADAPLVSLLRGCLPAVVEPPGGERFNRDIFARLRSGGEGRG